ncbi:galactonate dehydratase [Rhizobium sp. BK313]|uniref:mandelate racemase/muconate lactonizing enzyme family protein n=1 Tax=Rhizobium sp. BK313 TaxID=2587081 RepID=UPI00105B9E02|nr:mandelate racemase/muconate lactonizing enzyme family protein [Rhizobium sp. BK313]MBB3458194.1 galactonate dehydratase [Rhizobium sp. BK313]
MKITSITPWIVEAKGTYFGEFMFVEVKTDEGIVGWGEVTTSTKLANRSVAGVIRQLEELLKGSDPTQIESIWNRSFRNFTYMGSRGAACLAISGIDIALWDILGKSLNRPIYALLGGKVRDDVLLYTHPDQTKFTDPGAVKEEIMGIVESGHTALKFDPFPHLRGLQVRRNGYLDGELSREAERIGAELTALIRETTGPEIEILIDAHGRFNVPTAVRLCNRLKDAGQIDWFEEPVPPESYHALRQVREQIDVPIAVGERLHTRWEFVPILENQLADYIMPDVTWAGGISELKKIATMCEAYYVPVTPHDASGPINVVAGSHVMITTPNFYRVETSLHDLSSYNRFIQEPLDNSGGSLKLTDKPGLGIEMDMDFLRAHALDGYGG